jgi:capsular exopolysaccharide synthesis family protein
VSIVEKALIRAQAERAKTAVAPPATAAVPVEEQRADVLPWAAAGGEPLAVANRLAFEQFPALARDFRFLKRPVLARVFGMSRASQKTGNLVMITSDMPQAGKSFISLNLGASMASERMMRVLIVDADPVRHTLSTRLGVEGQPGLLELLAGDRAGLGDVVMTTDVDSLYFLPAGKARPDATELLGSPRMSQILKSLEDPNLVVLLDSPPLLLSSEGRVLADQVHHALVIVEAGRSTASDVAHVLQLLQGSTAAVNLVLNKTPVPGSARYKDYYYPY